MATVSNLRRDEGQAPPFEVVSQEEKADRAATSATEKALELPSQPVVEEEKTWLSSRQAICIAVGSRIVNLKKAGTLLAWLVVRAGEKDQGGAWRWLNPVGFEKIDPATGCGGPTKAASFPFRIGELEEVLEALRRASLDEVAGSNFSEKWAEDAWLYLALHSVSGLASRAKPLAKGRWSALEQRGAATARQFVQRLLKSHCGSVTAFEKIGKDLEAARVDYSGEETGVCEPLTLAQALPALPPMNHGGSIKLVDLVGCHP